MKIKSDRQLLGALNDIESTVSKIYDGLTHINNTVEAIKDYNQIEVDYPKTSYVHNPVLQKELVSFMRQFDTQFEAATILGVQQSNLNMMYHSKKPISKDVAYALGYQQVVVYKKITKGIT